MVSLARLGASITIALLTMPLVSCGGGGGGSSSPPVNSSTTSPSGGSGYTPGPNVAQAFTCPSSDTTLDASGGRASGGVSSETRRTFRGSKNTATMPVLAVVYRSSAISNPAATIDARVASLGASKISELAYPKIGLTTRLLNVSPSAITQVEATLRSTPGVVAVSQSRRLAPLTASPYLGNDPYFVGSAPEPLYQTANTAGQWDMHVVQLEHAFGYSQGGASVAANPNALGSQSVKLAIIDTGEDVTHPELAMAHVVHTKCFITSEDGSTQSTGTFVTDGFGHGTDVTGIAVANAQNDYGFVGDAGDVSLMLYRVFPTPDDNCANPDSTAGQNDPQCGADDTDIVSAIDDAVANGANVISMSLGGNNCTSAGVDPDPAEGAAVANAIADNVIVVAASGNAGGEGVTAPACDAGVIAVGASAYNDGVANGTGYTGTSNEYVASYSQYGATNVADSTSSWGLVAPGSDPSSADVSATQPDYLHWIENIWTSTPYMSSPSDTSFEGNCAASPEYNEQGNCRTLIAGTSMATPHVAGAAALILSVNPSYQSPSAMFQLLCTTADNLGSGQNQGCGRLNVYRAMAKALSDPSQPPPN